MAVPWRSLFTASALFWLAACSSPNSQAPAPEPIEPSVVVGVPAGEDQLGFAALDEGSVLELETFGQGGTHVTLAIRAIGLGQECYVTVGIENLNTGAEIEEATPSSGPRPLLCREPPACDLVPFYVMMGGLTQPDEARDGLPIEVTARVRNEAGDGARGSVSAFLSTRALPDE